MSLARRAQVFSGAAASMGASRDAFGVPLQAASPAREAPRGAPAAFASPFAHHPPAPRERRVSLRERYGLPAPPPAAEGGAAAASGQGEASGALLPEEPQEPAQEPSVVRPRVLLHSPSAGRRSSAGSSGNGEEVKLGPVVPAAASVAVQPSPLSSEQEQQGDAPREDTTPDLSLALHQVRRPSSCGGGGPCSSCSCCRCSTLAQTRCGAGTRDERCFLQVAAASLDVAEAAEPAHDDSELMRGMVVKPEQPVHRLGSGGAAADSWFNLAPSPRASGGAASSSGVSGSAHARGRVDSRDVRLAEPVHAESPSPCRRAQWAAAASSSHRGGGFAAHARAASGELPAAQQQQGASPPRWQGDWQRSSSTVSVGSAGDMGRRGSAGGQSARAASPPVEHVLPTDMEAGEVPFAHGWVRASEAEVREARSRRASSAAAQWHPRELQEQQQQQQYGVSSSAPFDATMMRMVLAAGGGEEEGGVGGGGGGDGGLGAGGRAASAQLTRSEGPRWGEEAGEGVARRAEEGLRRRASSGAGSGGPRRALEFGGAAASSGQEEEEEEEGQQREGGGGVEPAKVAAAAQAVDALLHEARRAAETAERAERHADAVLRLASGGRRHAAAATALGPLAAEEQLPAAVPAAGVGVGPGAAAAPAAKPFSAVRGTAAYVGGAAAWLRQEVAGARGEAQRGGWLGVARVLLAVAWRAPRRLPLGQALLAWWLLGVAVPLALAEAALAGLLPGRGTRRP